MKKTVVGLLLCGVLALLASCGGKEQQDSPAASPSPTMTSSPSGEPTASAEVTAAPSQTPVPSPTFCVNPDDLTIPTRQPVVPPERYESDVQPDFVARNGYGKVYPYFNRMYGSPLMEMQCVYGFADENGKIISDPSYSSVSVLRHDNKVVYLASRNKSMGKRSFTLIGGDGSWSYEVKLPEGEYYYTYFFEQLQAIPVYNGSKWGAIGWNGKLLLDYRYDQMPCVKNDRVAVSSEVDGKGYVTYYDLGGAKLLGPLLMSKEHDIAAGPERLIIDSGLAVFMGDNGLYGYMALDGTVAIEPQFEGAQSFSDGEAMVNKGESSYYIDIHNEKIRDYSSEYTLSAGYKVISNDSYSQFWVIDPEGRRLNYVLDRNPDSVIGGDTLLCYNYDDRLVELRDVRTGNVKKTVPLNENDTLTWVGPDDSSMFGILRYNNGTQLLMELFDEDGNAALPPRPYYQCFNGVLLCSDGVYGGLMDMEGNWILRVSLEPMGNFGGD